MKNQNYKVFLLQILNVFLGWAKTYFLKSWGAKKSKSLQDTSI